MQMFMAVGKSAGMEKIAADVFTLPGVTQGRKLSDFHLCLLVQVRLKRGSSSTSKPHYAGLRIGGESCGRMMLHIEVGQRLVAGWRA
jgi:hypothetical protein